MRKRVYVVLFLVLVLCALPTLLQAQGTGTASITGVVTDQSGSVLPGASIKIVDTRTNAEYFGKTSGDGSYRITDLPPGPGYSLTIKKDGFQTVSIANLYLPVAVTTTQDVRLQLGSIEQTVTVTATGSVTLDTTDTTIGNPIDMHAVSNLPNEYRDDPSNLLRLEVGVVSAQTPPGGPASGTGSIDPNLTRDGAVAGARTDQNNIVVDGIDATNISNGFAFTTTAAIPVEAIQEFNTLVANPTPEYGGGSGAQTLITTKSGTNDYHGSVYEFNRNAATEADSFFNNLSEVPRTALVRNQFGANVGGPIWKNKAFFFFEYDGRRDAEAVPELDIVPMPHVKLGELAYVNNSGGSTCSPESRLTSADASTACVTIAPALEVQGLDPCSNSAFACSSNTPGFQAVGVDPALISLFKSRYPNPNDFSAGDGLNTAGYEFNAPTTLTENNYLSHEDFNINNKNQLFVRFNFRNLNGTLVPIAFPGDPETSPETIRDRAWVIGETWTASSNLVNRFTYGETRQNLSEPILFNPAENLYLLTFDSGNVSNPYIRQTSFGITAPEPTFRDDITYIYGNHTFSFGGEWRPVVVEDGLTNDFNFIQQGLGGNLTNLQPSLRPPDILEPSTMANPTSDPNGVAIANWDSAFVGSAGTIFDLQSSFLFTHSGVLLPQGTNVVHDYRITNLAGYFNDAWKIRSDLTINLGVRYQYQGVPYEVHGLQASFFNTSFRQIIDTRVANGLAGVFGPDVTPELTYSLSGNANHSPALYSPEYHDLSPRIGLAWNPSVTRGFLGRLLGDRKTVFRLGGALIYDQTVVNNIIFIEGQGDYTFGGSFAEDFGGFGASPESNFATMPRFNSITSSPVAPTPPTYMTPVTPSAVFNYDIDNQFHTPYAITASFGIQRELPGGLQFEADYYGRFGRKLFVLSDAGQLVNFVDPASGQSLAAAFTYLEKQAQMGTAVGSIVPQNFFEDIFGAGATAAIYSNFESSLALGNTAGVAYELGGSVVNIGFTPQFVINALATNQGSSSYNALFTTLRKRLTHNLQFDFDYTYSHAIDNNSSVASVNGNYEPGVTTLFCDATNPHVCRGNAEFDATNQITAYFVYDLPFGRGQAFGSNSGKLLNEAIGGWEISGIETWRTGLALTADSGVASTTSLASDAGEVFVGSKSALATSIHMEDGEVQFYKDPAAAVAAYTPDLGLQVGTRDNLRGPHFSNFDVAVLKNFPLVGERYKLQFRADAYNAFNHTNFGLPNPVLTEPNFGQLTSEAGTEQFRVMQFALRFDF